MRVTNQRVAKLQHQVQQPRLATEADVRPDTKTLEHTKSAEVDEEKYGDISSARVDDNPTTLTNFANKVEPLAPEKGIGNALVNEGTEAPKTHLPPVEVRMLTSTAGGLVLAGTVFTTLRAIFPPPPLPWSFCKTIEERSFSTITIIHTFAKYNNFWHSEVIETKSRQFLVFDPGGCSGGLCGYPFLGGQRALLLGRVRLGRCDSVWSLIMFC